MTNKLNAKLGSKDAMLTSKSDEQIKMHSNATDAAEPKAKSRQRRLSRTLSPSEVKMLHSATSTKDTTQNVQPSKYDRVESSGVDNEYDYEDDFEVNSENKL